MDKNVVMPSYLFFSDSLYCFMLAAEAIDRSRAINSSSSSSSNKTNMFECVMMAVTSTAGSWNFATEEEVLAGDAVDTDVVALLMLKRRRRQVA